ncbi:Ig-like domain-containing protein [Erythrobacter sp. W302b]|uniref:Ig-like domain-containing protein n=1 Tax=Erythrobacter sp. W302b TaxID=3389874 RepID=UPI00396B4496
MPTEAELAAAKVAAANAVAESEEVLAKLAEDAEKDKEELQLAAAEEAEADVVETAEFTATAPAIDLTSGLTTVQFAQAGAPARQGVDGAASLGQDDEDGGISGVLIGVLALAAIGGGIAVAAGGGNKESDLPSNRPPVAGDDTLAATEGSGTVNLSVTGNDSDPDGNALTYTANGTLPVGVTLSAAGAVTFDSNNAEYNSLAAGATRVLTFSYTVNDGNGGTDTANVTLTVTGTNDAPVAVADTAAATEDAPAVTGSVATNDSDVDAGTTLTYALAAPVAGLTLNANGTYSFDPSNAAYQPLAAGATQVVVANYTVSDGAGGTATSTLTITVTGTNDAPVAVADVATATEDGAVVTGSVATNDSDVDTGATLTYAVVGTAPAGVTLNADGSYSFDPSNAAYQSLGAGATQSVVVNYTVSDGIAPPVASTLTITVTGVNDAPVAVADVATATEDGAVVTGSVATNDSDVDVGDVRTYAIVGTAPAGLTLNADGSYSFDPSNAAYQSLAVGATQVVVANYTVSDGKGGTATSTLTITVTGTNDAPVAVADVYEADEGTGVVTGDLSDNDSDVDVGDVLTYSVVGNAPAGLTLNADGSWEFDTDNAAYDSLAVGEEAVATFTYEVSDGNGGTDQATVTLTVNGTNDAPVAVDDVYEATEGTGIVTGNLSDNDSDVDASDVLTYSIVGNAPAGLTLNADGSWEFDTDDAAYDSLAVGETAVATFTYEVSDGNGGTDQATVTLTVNGTNDAPVAVADVATATEDGPDVTGSVATNDSDVDASDVLTYALAAPVAGLTLNADGSYTFDTSDPAYQSLRSGATQVVVANYTVSDGNGGTAASTLTITITGTNDAPVITSPTTGTVSENAPATTVVYDASATDVDAGDVLSYSISGADAAAFNIDAATGEVRLNAPANFERKASYSVTITATDNGNPALSATQAITIAVADEIDVLSIDDLGAIGAPVVVNAGIQAGDVTDTNFQFTETSGGFTEVNIVDFGANDFIFFDGFDPSDYTFQDDGNGNLVISRLDDDGATTNLITLVDVLDGLTIDPIVTEADAEAALALAFGAGDYFRGSAAPSDVAIASGTATFNAAGVQATFIEDLDAPESFIRIENFRADDRIVFIDGDIGEVSFSTDPDDARDLRIEYFDFTTNQASTIILDNVLDPDGPIVFDEASAEAAVGAIIGAGDYFQVG